VLPSENVPRGAGVSAERAGALASLRVEATQSLKTSPPKTIRQRSCQPEPSSVASGASVSVAVAPTECTPSSLRRNFSSVAGTSPVQLLADATVPSALRAQV
jgi:hypothetical protein